MFVVDSKTHEIGTSMNNSVRKKAGQTILCHALHALKRKIKMDT